MEASYKYTFDNSIAFDDVCDTLMLAVIATESMHGEISMRLDTPYRIRRDDRVIMIDAAVDTGRDLNRIFGGYVAREFGRKAYTVSREQPVLTMSAGDAPGGKAA